MHVLFFISRSVERQLVSTHFDTSSISNKTGTPEKRVLFCITHFDVLKKTLNESSNSFQTSFFFHPVLISYQIQFVLTVCLFSIPFLFVWLQFYLCLFVPIIYVPLLACVNFLSLLSELCSVQFLIFFANVFYSFLLVYVSLGPQLFSLLLLWVESSLVPILSLSSVHVSLKAAPPGWVWRMYMYTWQCLSTLL